MTKELGFKKKFDHLFLVSGKRITNLDEIPKDCKAIVVSHNPKFKGTVQIKKTKQEFAEYCVKKWLGIDTE